MMMTSKCPIALNIGPDCIRATRANCSRWADYDLAGRLIDAGSDWCTTPTYTDYEDWQAAVTECVAAIAPIVGHGWHRLDLYIRFGRLPRGGRSRNHATGSSEQGISCYSARLAANGTIILAGDGLSGAAIMAAAGQYDDYAILVSGRRVGTGSDGEPLIASPKILSKLTWDEGKSGFVACANA